VHGASVRSQTVEGNDGVRQACDDTSNFCVASGSKFSLSPLVDGSLPAVSFRVRSPPISAVSCILRLAATNPLPESICLVGEAEWKGKVAESGMANGKWVKENGSRAEGMVSALWFPKGNGTP